MNKKETRVTRRQFCKGLGILGATAGFLSVFPISAMAAGNNNLGVPVLVYHNFSQAEGSTLCTPGEVFANQMEYLLHNGYSVISLRRLIDHMQGNSPLTGKPVVITFDDGYKSTYTQAFPILQQYQVCATVFAITSKVGTPGYMTWEDALKMDTSGFIDIQGHTHDLHYEVFTEPSLKKIRPAVLGEGYLPELKQYETKEGFEYKLLQDFAQNREVLESKLRIDNADMLAWPFGAYNERALRLAKKAGFSYFLTLLNGNNKVGGNPSYIRRRQCSGSLSQERFAKLLSI